MKKLMIGTVAGGVILFLWGAVSHMLLPFSNDAFLRFTNEDEVIQTLHANAPQSGVYFLPYVPMNQGTMSDAQFKRAQEEAQEKMQKGPFMFASIRMGDMGSSGGYFAMQLLSDLLSAFFVCLILSNMREMSFRNSIVICLLVALTAFAAQTAPLWNWYSFSDAFTFAELFDVVFGFLFAGLVMAKVMAPKKQNLPVSGEELAGAG